MSKDWCPSRWGRLLTRSPHWWIRLEGEQVELGIGERRYQASLKSEQQIQVTPGIIWSRVEMMAKGGLQRLGDGLPNADGALLTSAISKLVAERRKRERTALFNATLALISAWVRAAHDLVDQGEADRRWISHDQQQEVLASRPELAVAGTELKKLFLDQKIHQDLDSPAHRQALSDLHDWGMDWPALWERANESMTTRELVLAKDFMDRVESEPLTEEQARAVICFDNRVQVVASAGSGKTSTMVAKAAYAIHRGFIEPDRIVMLAFNKGAAAELKQRAEQALDRLGMTGVSTEARTFHSLGRAIIGKATGRMLEVPEWTKDAEKGLAKLLELVDQLKDRSEHFRTQWDMFRLVFGRDLPPLGVDSLADGYDSNGRPYISSLKGERVQSMEERIIADWLFYNGVSYQYERAYEFDTVTDTHRQYRPDFYYPDVDAYHEHLALDANGRAPKHFTRYMEDLAWKRDLHARRGWSHARRPG